MTKSNAGKPASIPAALTNFDQLPDSANVDVYVVAGLCGGGVSTVWRRLRQNDPLIPKPRKFGRSTRFNVGELRAALAANAAGAAA